jgi:lipocalin
MSFKVQILSSVFFYFVLQLCINQAEGNCPAVAPMANFDPTKFIGRWYAIQRYQVLTDALAASCTSMNLTMTGNVLNLEFCNLLRQQAAFRIAAVLLSSGIINFKFRFGLSKFV